MTPFPSRSVSSARGMALLLVIAVVGLLIAIVIGLRVSTESSWDESTLSRMRFQARLLAESGANLALHPEIERGDPVLSRDFDDGRAYQVTITTEGGRILVNQLSEEVFVEGVTELFVIWGLDASLAATAAESLADWVDEDSEVRTNGAEEAFYAGLDYPEFPANAPFSSLETMLLVRGMDQVARVQPRWRDFFTIYGDGLIDLNSAEPDVIEAFLGVTPEAALNFVAAGWGDDGIAGNEDDEPVTDEAAAQDILGISSEEWAEKSANLTLEGVVRRIESLGIVGDTRVRLVVLTDISQGEEELASPIARYTE